jgi:hypothetical protein
MNDRPLARYCMPPDNWQEYFSLNPANPSTQQALHQFDAIGPLGT